MLAPTRSLPCPTVARESARNSFHMSSIGSSRRTFRLPSSDVTAIPWRPPSADGALNHSSSTVSLDAITVLVVEDEPDTREFLQRLLETHGAEVVVAGSAVEALSVFPSARPDILVSDIGLPGVDGYDLMQ